MDKAGLLFSWQKNNRIGKRKQDSDDEDDVLIDETGEKESKKIRLEALRNRKVENLDTLNKRLDELKTEIETLKVELDEVDREIGASKSGNRERNDDELDQYMKTMSSNKYSLNDLKIKKSKARMKMAQLSKEKERTEKLIKIAQPSQTTYKVKDSSKSNKVSELLEKAKAKLNEKKLESTKSIVVTDDAKSQSNIDQRTEETFPKPTKGFTFNKPTIKNVLKPSTFSSVDDDEVRSEKRKRILMDLDEENAEEKVKLSKIDFNDKAIVSKMKLSRIDVDEIEKIKDNSSGKKQSPPLKSKKQTIIRRDEDEQVEEDKFVDWVPPESNEAEFSLDKSDDGRSHLNDKYGY